MFRTFHLAIFALALTSCGSPETAVDVKPTDPSEVRTALALATQFAAVTPMTATPTHIATSTSAATSTPAATITPVETTIRVQTATTEAIITPIPARATEAASPVTPTQAPTDTSSPTSTAVPELSVDDQITSVVHDAVSSEQGKAAPYIYDLGDERGVEVTFTFEDASRVPEAGQVIAYNIHRALWTSELPIGSVAVIIYEPDSFRPWFNAKAGSVLMNTYTWEGVEPPEWAAYLREHRSLGGSEQEGVWYNDWQNPPPDDS